MPTAVKPFTKTECNKWAKDPVKNPRTGRKVTVKQAKELAIMCAVYAAEKKRKAALPKGNRAFPKYVPRPGSPTSVLDMATMLPPMLMRRTSEELAMLYNQHFRRLGRNIDSRYQDQWVEAALQAESKGHALPNFEAYAAPPLPMANIMSKVEEKMPRFDPSKPISQQPEWLAFKRADPVKFEKALERQQKAEKKKKNQPYIDPLVMRESLPPVCPDLYFFDSNLGICKTTKRGFQELGGDRTTRPTCPETTNLPRRLREFSNIPEYYYDGKAKTCTLKRKPKKKDPFQALYSQTSPYTEAQCADLDGYFWDGSRCAEFGIF